MPPFRPPARLIDRFRRRNAFSLWELTVVVVILAILLALAAPSYFLREASPRHAAEELTNALRLARQYAVDHGARTRLVFADDELNAFTQEKCSNAYGVYTFYVPLADAPNLPGELVGQWIPLPSQPEWRAFPESVKFQCSFAANDEVFLKKLFFNPPQTWDPNGADFFAPNYRGSVFPLNYWQTPYPTSFPLLATNQLPAYFPANAPLTYFHPPFHSQNVGVVETASAGASRIFFNLPGIEFDPQGKSTFTDTNRLTVRFEDRRNPNNTFTVVVEGVTGVVRMEHP